MKKYLKPQEELIEVETQITCESNEETKEREYTDEELERILIGWDKYDFSEEE